MIETKKEKSNIAVTMPVIAASYLGPALQPNSDAAWEEGRLPLSADELVQKTMGQPMRRAGRFIKVVCCGALACLKSVPPEGLKGKKIGIFLATGLGNVDEILPFITQVFKYEGGFPSPNQFANSVSNAAAFFLARICEINGVVLTISQEELSFESALWLAQSYLSGDQIDLALVGGCDVFTPSVDDYRARMNLSADNSRNLPAGEGSSWLLLGDNGSRLGDIIAVKFGDEFTAPRDYSVNNDIENDCQEFIKLAAKDAGLLLKEERHCLLPGFRLPKIDEKFWRERGWKIQDYLPHCGIHPTAGAFGIARAMLTGKNSLYVHYNRHASGKQALVAALKKS
jgi:hypothetical protein